jgi:hypothetical protein
MADADLARGGLQSDTIGVTFNPLLARTDHTPGSSLVGRASPLDRPLVALPVRSGHRTLLFILALIRVRTASLKDAIAPGDRPG